MCPTGEETVISKQPVIELAELGAPWHGLDPLIFTVHHVCAPAGNDRLGPDASPAG